jgi:putative membrane protein
MIENRTWRQWVRELASLMLGVLAATRIVRGINCEDTGTLLSVVVALAFLNTLARPFLRSLFILLFMPLMIATLGLAAVFVLWVVNSLLFYFTSALVTDFRVDSFGDAMLGALVVSTVSWLMSLLLGNEEFPRKRPPAGRPRRDEDDNDVIDV